MTREDLLNLLKIPVSTATHDDLEVTDIEVAEVQTPASDTALVLDEWSIRRGGEVLAESEKLRGMFEIPDSLLGSELDSARLATADFHSAAFEPSPTLADRCKNERIHRYMKNLMETPEFQALHSETQLDEVASEIATAAFAEKYVALIKQKEPEDEFKKDMQAVQAAACALSQATQEVSDLRDAQDALGVGQGNPGALNSKQLADAFKRVRGSYRLKAICERAGRFRRFAQAQQRKKVLHGRDDMVGVVLDGDIGRLLPSELVQLDDPDLELDVMRKIIERQAMCRDYRGIESKAKGPIVVVVDESGSMDGSNIHDAKAISLALAHVAQTQNRWCCLVGFSHGPDGNYCVLPPGKPQPETLMNWLEHFYNGGTSLDVPLVEVPAKWSEIGAPHGKTDIILITDGIVPLKESVRTSFQAFKAAEQVKLITLILGQDAGQLPEVSDRVHVVNTLGLGEEAVAEVLGV